MILVGGGMMEILKTIKSCEKTEDAFLLQGDAADIKIYFLSTDEFSTLPLKS